MILGYLLVVLFLVLLVLRQQALPRDLSIDCNANSTDCVGPKLPSTRGRGGIDHILIFTHDDLKKVLPSCGKTKMRKIFYLQFSESFVINKFDKIRSTIAEYSKKPCHGFFVAIARARPHVLVKDPKPYVLNSIQTESEGRVAIFILLPACPLIF